MPLAYRVASPRFKSALLTAVHTRKKKKKSEKRGETFCQRQRFVLNGSLVGSLNSLLVLKDKQIERGEA